MSEEILVVKRKTLFGDKTYQGFIQADEDDFVSKIISNAEFMERAPAETNAEFQQPIPYIWIINPKTKKAFIYRRSLERDKKGYKETRHKDKWSGGVGGHIDKNTEENETNPIEKAIQRELQEEVVMEKYPPAKILGYINDDEDEIGKVHFGIIATIQTEEDVKIAEHSDEMAHAQFYSIDEIDEIFANPENKVENWTQISWPVIKQHIQNLPNQ